MAPWHVGRAVRSGLAGVVLIVHGPVCIHVQSVSSAETSESTAVSSAHTVTGLVGSKETLKVQLF